MASASFAEFFSTTKGWFSCATIFRISPTSVAAIGLPAVLGVVIGTAIQQRVPVQKLSYGFALLLAAVGVRLLV